MALGLMGGIYALKVWVFVPESIIVTTIPVERGQVEETITNSQAGTVKARRRANLSPEIGGRVVSVPHRKGSHVKTGDILLQLNDASQRAAVLMAERELNVTHVRQERACLVAARAQREFVRNRQLRDRDLVSTNFLDKIENAAQTTAVSCKQANAEIAQVRAVIEEAKAELAKTVLYAPFDGVVAELDIETGEWTTPSPPALPVPPVIDLIDPSSIYVSAPMDEVDSSRIQLDQPVRITLDPYPKQSFLGRVVRIAPYVLDVEEQNRTVEIEVEFGDQVFASGLLPGTSADVEVILSVHKDVLRVPSSTVFEGDKVFLVKHGQLEEQTIKTGLKNWDYVEITSGLSVGDGVVSSLDQLGLAHGVSVTEQAQPGTR